MFTGLVEEVGSVKNIESAGNGKLITFNALLVTQHAKLGDSINVNGVCQTVVDLGKNYFSVEAVEETLKKTNFDRLKINEKVNFESSLTLNKKLGGHFVLGHVDTTGKIIDVKKQSSSYLLKINFSQEFEKYIIHVGSIAVDGISLTIADFTKDSFTISVIPHTWENTNFKFRKLNDYVNLEFDVLGKYVDKILNKKSNSKISEEWLKDLGY